MKRSNDTYARFGPPREWELTAFGLALFALASVPIAWLLHGFGNVRAPWTVLPVAVVLIAAGVRLRRKRLTKSKVFRSAQNGA